MKNLQQTAIRLWKIYCRLIDKLFWVSNILQKTNPNLVKKSIRKQWWYNNRLQKVVILIYFVKIKRNFFYKTP